MKRLLVAFALLLAVMTFSWNSPALAGDADKGAAIFSAKCVQCHAGGNNPVNPAKTLQMADLEKYGKNTIKAIVAQVTNGKGAMPGFKAQLKPEQIEDVAAYVLAQAKKGWK